MWQKLELCGRVRDKIGRNEGGGRETRMQKEQLLYGGLYSELDGERSVDNGGDDELEDGRCWEDEGRRG
ncbi:hypothetical protein SERLA73DRAFT_185140, partial [Serpula lacrymans var. lacrymans S7.3]